MTSSYSTFTRLPELPTELRLQIWQLYLPGHRDIQIFPRSTLETIVAPSPEVKGSTTPATYPTILAVNKESRSVALQKYDIIRSSPNRSLYQGPGGSRLIAFNSEEDMICFGRYPSG
ncbi:uncharacterized protein PAC_16508 [Phialocephala subalpina]|uniref:2EXR domain-containing protein n=1 Tax=Phialocephala subalpina TaxID=576137 RepID=A0A1L7XNT5_9HELO|nr:uncharacterized protein PAC_16508 [Phialocephala subalpina]